jgi:hypothetical protein
MLIYRISDDMPERNPPQYAATIADAKAIAKSDQYFRPYVEIELLDIKPEKHNVVRMLAGEFPVGVKRVKRWGLTDRGGLRALAPADREEA